MASSWTYHYAGSLARLNAIEGRQRRNGTNTFRAKKKRRKRKDFDVYLMFVLCLFYVRFVFVLCSLCVYFVLSLYSFLLCFSCVCFLLRVSGVSCHLLAIRQAPADGWVEDRYNHILHLNEAV